MTSGRLAAAVWANQTAQHEGFAVGRAEGSAAIEAQGEL